MSTLHLAQTFLNRIVTPFLDFIYPPQCLGCGTYIDYREFSCPVCLADAITLPMTEDASQEHLASLTFHSLASAMFVGYEFEHEGILEACLHTMKYKGMYRIGEWLGRLLGERLAETTFMRGNPVLVPVPLHKVKQLERGFNQADALCKGIAEETALECCFDALIRQRYTDSQAASKLHESERRENVLNAFQVNPKRIEVLRERPVALVDDLITTGATIGECAVALHEQGITDIRFVAVARPTKSVE